MKVGGHVRQGRWLFQANGQVLTAVDDLQISGKTASPFRKFQPSRYHEPSHS